MKHSNLKIVFVGFILIVVTGVCFYTFVLEELTPLRYYSRKCSSLQDSSSEYNDSAIEYLWRPVLVNNCHTFSDRIGTQLKWTKTFLNSQKKFRGKNVLLMFGKRRQFWHTGNRIQCPGFSIDSSQCNLTSSKSLTGVFSPGDFDALIYTDDSNSKPWGLKVPEYVKEIVYTQESPFTQAFRGKDRNSRMLWSSYARGSDIVVSYAKWVAFDDENIEYFNFGATPTHLPKKKDYAEGKTGFVVTFISNCETINDRLKYIEELRKYIPVDILGNCGIQLPSCLRGTAGAGSREDQQQCLNSVVTKYKFYLAFENSNCRDYITEKLFSNALNNDVVPVVMGAHPNDYKYAAPPNSFIHIEDFQSPKYLADYLTTLDRNRALYNQFFLWKGTGTFYNPTIDLFCRLCGMLFYSDFVQPPLFSKENATWANVDTCLPQGKWYWDR